ncbi:LytTR family DNA-binding domain-containing protein [Lacimicrobium sp. SS2-24]|uniref:LytR/AlgR family response regulator transcription factor n=1 Tax=Lacimicrobium sp. SS2-24 TaxID=2005569 RepID=UPI000B4AE4E2|nr:LytTR family DNA-binding domain-containing protein [Lacimicrobium sp. SS2-24]
MTVNCWIIDDEPAAHKGILLALQKHRDFEVIYQGHSADDPQLKQLATPDLVFLDIEMPTGTGFQLLSLWEHQIPQIVFITAYHQYAVEAFDHNALDYLLKPIEQARFDVMIEKVRQRINEKSLVSKRSAVEALYTQLKQQASPMGLSIKTSEGLFYVRQKQIIYIEAVADHLAYHFENKTLLSRDSFKRLSLDLDPDFFFRCHKSYIVNTAHVLRVEKGRYGDAILTMSQGDKVKMSRRYKDLLKHLQKHGIKA